jgi:nitrate reductase NapE component
MPDEPEVEVSKSDGGSPLLLFPEIIGFFALPFFLFKELLTGNSLIGGVGLILWFFGLIFLLVCIRRRRYYLAGLPILVLFGLYLLTRRMLGS